MEFLSYVSPKVYLSCGSEIFFTSTRKCISLQLLHFLHQYSEHDTNNSRPLLSFRFKFCSFFCSHFISRVLLLTVTSFSRLPYFVSILFLLCSYPLSYFVRIHFPFRYHPFSYSTQSYLYLVTTLFLVRSLFPCRLRVGVSA